MSRIYLVRSGVPQLTERGYTWKYLNDYCLDKWEVVVKHYSNVKKIVDNPDSCIGWTEV